MNSLRAVPGSSPRVRGKPGGLEVGDHGHGLIPARAGKTHHRDSIEWTRTAHPRACGENPGAALPGQALPGSSPRVRGKRALGHASPSTTRLIPARAGKTFPAQVGMTLWGAHPRACGENEYDQCTSAKDVGSSPRVRGKLGKGAGSRARSGLIPARAGKTPFPPPRCRGWWAHPRACGENLRLHEELVRAHGSSPRVRGKPLGHHRAHERRRLIPARAGKTGSSELSVGDRVLVGGCG